MSTLPLYNANQPPQQDGTAVQLNCLCCNTNFVELLGINGRLNLVDLVCCQVFKSSTKSLVDFRVFLLHNANQHVIDVLDLQALHQKDSSDLFDDAKSTDTILLLTSKAKKWQPVISSTLRIFQTVKSEGTFKGTNESGSKNLGSWKECLSQHNFPSRNCIGLCFRADLGSMTQLRSALSEGVRRRCATCQWINCTNHMKAQSVANIKLQKLSKFIQFNSSSTARVWFRLMSLVFAGTRPTTFLAALLEPIAHLMACLKGRDFCGGSETSELEQVWSSELECKCKTWVTFFEEDPSMKNGHDGYHMEIFIYIYMEYD